jgi:hypothetical protein
MNIRVYTNSLANFEILSSKVPVTLIGGEYRSHRKDFAGYVAEVALEKIHLPNVSWEQMAVMGRIFLPQRILTPPGWTKL